jgi:hypothetical protein
MLACLFSGGEKVSYISIPEIAGVFRPQPTNKRTLARGPLRESASLMRDRGSIIPTDGIAQNEA